MSKIRYDGEFGIPKHKLIRRQRRAETHNKHAQRVNAVKNNATYVYWIDDEDRVCEYTTTHVPESVEEKFHYSWIVPLGCETSKLVKISDGVVLVPAHDRKIRTNVSYVAKTPILKRSHYGMKSYRKVAARAFRRTTAKNITRTIGKSEYKRYYDLEYMVF